MAKRNKVFKGIKSFFAMIIGGFPFMVGTKKQASEVDYDAMYQQSIISEGEYLDKLASAKKHLNELQLELIVGKKLQAVEPIYKDDFREQLIILIENQKKLVAFWNKKINEEIEKRNKIYSITSNN